MIKKYIFEKVLRYTLLAYSFNKNEYNLFCVYSLLDKKTEAIYFFKEFLKKNKDILNESYSEVIKSDLEYDFLNIKNETSFISLLDKYKILL